MGAAPGPVMSPATTMPEFVIDRRGLQSLLDVLHDAGHDVRGPVVHDGTIVAMPIDGVDQLPTGVTLDQAPGRVELRSTARSTSFSWASPPQAWKPILHPPETTMSVGRPVEGDGHTRSHVEMVPVPEPTRRRPLALVGLRPCDAAALRRLDTVLLDRATAPDVGYEHRRRGTLTVVVDCARPAATCFCASTGDGPHVGSDPTGVDIELTEFDAELGDIGHPVRYLVRAHSERGAAVVSAIPPARRRLADADDRALRDRQRDESAVSQTRRIPDLDQLRGVGDRVEHPVWEDVAETCVACGNCTSVCPTCFCVDIVDAVDLDGTVERRRRWDTCFSLEFSRLGSSIVRSSISSRYRQWLLHKFDTWFDQFGESGCVGCGRCVAACPVGIDVVAQLDAVVASDRVDS